MAEAFFDKVAQDVLLVTEQIQTVMEEGIGILLNGGAVPKNSGSDGTSETASTGGDEFVNTIQEEEPDWDNLSEEEIERMLAEEMKDGSPLTGIANNVLGNIMSTQIGPQTPREHFDAFRSAITWSENFILGLIAFQVLMFVLSLAVSRRDGPLTPRVCVLLFIGIVVRSAERLNSLGSQHWKSFATQDYFDSRGVFVGIMLCGPLLLDCLMMLFMFLREASTLVVQVKKEELKRKKKKKDSNNGTQSTATTEQTKAKKQD